MKKIFLLFNFLFAFVQLYAQNPTEITDEKVKKQIFDQIKKQDLKHIRNEACMCIDSIRVDSKTPAENLKGIRDCIDQQVIMYQLTSKLFDTNKGTANKEIAINTNKNSEEYKEFYEQIEQSLLDSCKAILSVLASNDKHNANSMSKNPEAVEWYNKGIEAYYKEDYKEAIRYYKKALKIDPVFAFAWDNLGISYRKLDQFDDAIEAYQKSLEIDPNGQMPLQNIAVAYIFKKDYEKAVQYYEKLATIDNKDPEVYYGLGQICALYLNQYEKGLNYMCKAYLLYIETGSAYRKDAEKIIGMIYGEMKKQGKEKEFEEILNSHNIKTK
jgi:tetratricopeptide (TPR) repeat protein